MCIPVQSNEDPKKWEDKEVELIGFATKDLRADRLKVAKVLVFNQTHCDTIMEREVKKIESNRKRTMPHTKTTLSGSFITSPHVGIGSSSSSNNSSCS